MAQIKCRHCEGTGKTPLPREYVETLAKIPSKGATAGDLCGSVKYGAMAMRLNRMEKMGFLTSEKRGRFIVYFNANPKRKKI